MEKRQDIYSKIAYYSFYLAVIIEVIIVIVDKSAYINPIEGRLFQLTFLLCFIKVCLTKYSWKEYVVIALFLGVGAVSYFVTGRNEIVRIVMFIAACKGIDMKACLKTVFFLTLIGCVVIVFLSIAGIGGAVSVTEDYGRGKMETRYAFGMGHPNAFQCMIWALTTLGLYIYGNKMRWMHYILLFLVTFFSFALTNSKTGLLAGIYTIVFFFLAASIQKSRIMKLFSAANIGIYLMSVLLSVVIAKDAMCMWRYYVKGIYVEKVKIYIWLDRLLTGRIASLIQTTNHEGVMETWSLFGKAESDYFFDLGWIRLFYWYGIIPALIAVIVIFLFLVYFYRKNKLMEIVIISAFSLYSVVEAHAISVYLARNYVIFIIGMYWWQLFVKQEES